MSRTIKRVNLKNASGRIVCSHEGCGKEYKDSIALSKHVSASHSGKILECEYCAGVYSTPSNLKRHVIRCSSSNRRRAGVRVLPSEVLKNCLDNGVNIVRLKVPLSYAHQFTNVVDPSPLDQELVFDPHYLHVTPPNVSNSVALHQNSISLEEEYQIPPTVQIDSPLQNDSNLFNFNCNAFINVEEPPLDSEALDSLIDSWMLTATSYL
eukprot:TRINITY_DN16313_c0_g1_i1.p1 TRINITY_DN16313_c0_g1~~TRINITY_DN16313_c0_g1_i1.p1  ORF type:complete len:209 (+),score=26.64 TRINITY_DN16313_c0_g1_i1:110-736(+)